MLGLIQVMQHLDNINAVGRGIAVAFAYAGHAVRLIDVKPRTSDAFATLQAGLTFQSWQLETPLLTLAVNQASLKNADQLILAELKSLLIDGLMKDVQRFLDWAKRGVLEGMQDVG